MPGRVLITGGHGFIGAQLSPALLERGYAVVRFGRGTPKPQDGGAENIFADMRNQAALVKSLHGCDVVFHKAAQCPSPTSPNDDSLFEANMENTHALIAALQANHSVKHVLFDSSISVYGEGCYLCADCGIVRPDTRTADSVAKMESFEPTCPACSSFPIPLETSETASLRGTSAYARSKQAQERVLQQASEKLGFKLTLFRYATVYGSGQRSNSTYGRFFRAIAQGKPITLNEDGMQRRDFVHIDDVIDANLAALQREGTGNLTVNLGSGNETSLRDFIATAVEVLSTSGRRSSVKVTNKLAPGDIRHCKISCDQASVELAFRAKIGIEQGLRGVTNHREKSTHHASAGPTGMTRDKL